MATREEIIAGWRDASDTQRAPLCVTASHQQWQRPFRSRIYRFLLRSYAQSGWSTQPADPPAPEPLPDTQRPLLRPAPNKQSKGEVEIKKTLKTIHAANPPVEVGALQQGLHPMDWITVGSFYEGRGLCEAARGLRFYGIEYRTHKHGKNFYVEVQLHSVELARRIVDESIAYQRRRREETDAQRGQHARDVEERFDDFWAALASPERLWALWKKESFAARGAVIGALFGLATTATACSANPLGWPQAIVLGGFCVSVGVLFGAACGYQHNRR